MFDGVMSNLQRQLISLAHMLLLLNKNILNSHIQVTRLLSPRNNFSQNKEKQFVAIILFIFQSKCSDKISTYMQFLPIIPIMKHKPARPNYHHLTLYFKNLYFFPTAFFHNMPNVEKPRAKTFLSGASYLKSLSTENKQSSI